MTNNLQTELAEIRESFTETGQIQMATYVMALLLKNLDVLKEEQEQGHFSYEALALASKSLNHIAEAVKERVEEINNKSIH